MTNCDHNATCIIKHHLTFEDKNYVDAFVKEIVNMGYVIEKQGDNELDVVHITPLQEDKVNRHVERIYELANKYLAIYEGWKR